MKRGFVFIAFLFLAAGARAQVQFSGWLGSFNTFTISNRFSLHFDGQLRSTDRWEQVGTILLRPGLNYHLNKSWTFTAGYAAAFGRRNLSGLSALLPEHRLWQQALLNYRISKVTVAHRFRFEERFLPNVKAVNNELKTDGFLPAYRFRYFVRSLFPLTAAPTFSKGAFLALQNEVFLNTGDKAAVNGKAFDQNRLYGALGYRLPGKLDLEAGYMNQNTATRTSFVNNHIVQLAIYKRL